jgi:hypothetical protein
MAKQEERIEMAILLKRLNHVDISFSGNSQDSTQHRLCSKFLSFSVQTEFFPHETSVTG